MVPRHRGEHAELRGRGATVTLEYDAPGHVLFSVRTDGRAGAAAEAARLTCEAVHQARSLDARLAELTLDVAGPASGVVLEALRRRRGNDLDRIVLRRAGASVMVALDVRPLPTLPRPAADSGGAVLPTQPVSPTQAVAPDQPVGCRPHRRSAGAAAPTGPA